MAFVTPFPRSVLSPSVHFTSTSSSSCTSFFSRTFPCSLSSAKCTNTTALSHSLAVFAQQKSSSSGPSFPKKVKLDPEVVFFEGRPSWTEVVIPTLAILTVIGIIPWMAAVARQLWCKYKITSRRISIDSGFQGKDHVEIIYRDIERIRYVRRFGGAAADIVFFLTDGAKLEMRALPDFEKNYDYIMTQVPESCRELSGYGPSKKEN